MNNYVTFADFGPKVQNVSANPLAICAVSGLDAGFNNMMGTSVLNPQAEQCQAFMGTYCGQNWDGVCEFLSHDNSRYLPNTLKNCNAPSTAFLTPGQILIRNAAAEKYLTKMSSNCRREYEPFDPSSAGSPLIGKWVAAGSSCSAGNCDGRGTCVPIYDVDAKLVDTDPVMNKLLNDPGMGIDILVNIYNTRVRNRTLSELSGTRLGQYFSQNETFRDLIATKAVKF